MPVTVPKNYLLLDTCVINYSLDKYMSASVAATLQEWIGKDLDLAVSEISHAELIHGAYKSKIEKVKKFLDLYAHFTVSQRVLEAAGVIGNIYTVHNSENRSLGLADRILAATSFIYAVPVVTANIKDFPHPFFNSIRSKNVPYKKKNKDHIIVVDVLKPNIEVLNYWYSKTQ